MKLFFSYTIRDGLVDVALLRRIAKRLECFSYSYFDLLEHRCGGHQPSVWKALEDADALLLCVTPRILDSPWVRTELSVANRRGIPVLAGSSESWLSADLVQKVQKKLTKPIQTTSAQVSRQTPYCITNENQVHKAGLTSAKIDIMPL